MEKYGKWLIVFITLSPYAALLFFTHLNWQIPLSELSTILSDTFLQATLSASLILVVGFFACLGLISIERPTILHALIVFAVLPSLLPPLIVIMSVLNFWQALSLPLELGLFMVTLTHVLIYFGIAACAWRELIVSRLGGALELAAIEGARPWILYKVIWKELRHEAKILWFTFFTLTFTSFSVPLILGGQNGKTLEVFAYELMTEQSSLGGAIIIGVGQWLFFGVLAFYLGATQVSNLRFFKKIYLPNAAWLNVLTALAAVLSLSGLFFGALVGFKKLFTNVILLHSLSGLAINSFLTSGLCGIYVFLFFYALCWLISDRFVVNWFTGYTTPSVVLLGLAFYLLPLKITNKLAVGLAFLFVPALYRLQMRSSFESLRQQIAVAQVLGASRSQMAIQIIWPQVRHVALFLSGLAAFWASCDFAFSSIVTGQIMNLALTARSLLSSYHMDLAIVYVWLSVFIGLILFLIFWSLSYVTSRRLSS
jgi:ABC-type Fe3+ transport system permease subunit